MTYRACPSLVPKKRDLKKLLEGPSSNFWYNIMGDEYLEASVLGTDVVAVEKLRRYGWHASWRFLGTMCLASKVRRLTRSREILAAISFLTENFGSDSWLAKKLVTLLVALLGIN